ncbi:alanine racemase [Bacteroides fragilis]|nr:alanine racemase [Bacteroides fragilis]
MLVPVIDLDAIAHNVSLLNEKVAPASATCAWSKADAYGHGVKPRNLAKSVTVE